MIVEKIQNIVEPMKALLIEDDRALCKIFDRVMAANDIDHMIVQNGTDGEQLAMDEEFDIIILDLGLPDKHGIDVCKNLRKQQNTTPILILSAQDETKTKVKSLEIGADDYLTKPFDTEELIARITAITRRNNVVPHETTEEIECGELKLNLMERTFFVAQKEVRLTNNEFDLLAHFMKNSDRIISPEELSAEVWDIHFDTQTNYVNVYISYLRKKIAEQTDREYIETIRGEGFRLNSSGGI